MVATFREANRHVGNPNKQGRPRDLNSALGECKQRSTRHRSSNWVVRCHKPRVAMLPSRGGWKKRAATTKFFFFPFPGLQVVWSQGSIDNTPETLLSPTLVVGDGFAGARIPTPHVTDLCSLWSWRALHPTVLKDSLRSLPIPCSAHPASCGCTDQSLALYAPAVHSVVCPRPL